MENALKNFVVLMLEHDEDDRYITQSVFDHFNAPAKIIFVKNSNEFIDFLKNCPMTDLPSLFLISQFSVPLNAVGVLEYIRSEKHLTHIPSVVLSGITDEKLVRECYAAGASSYIRKPHNNEETIRKISSFIDYWFQTVELT